MEKIIYWLFRHKLSKTCQMLRLNVTKNEKKRWKKIVLHEVAIDFGVWIKPNMHGWNARIYFECHYIMKQTFNMILLLSWWFVEPLNLQICHIFKPSENIWWQRRSKWISIKISVKVNRLKWVATIWWLHVGWYEV